jgi:regulator of protease activity HflC (stomatin/prohibitin superfamily)
MTDASPLVTVYRSMDPEAQEDCETIATLLTAEGLSPVILDDTAPGVPEGVYEVCVPPNEAAKAEEVIASNPLPDEVEEVDEASELDLEPIYHSEGNPTAEVEAIGIKNVLEANGIAAVIVGDSVLPNLAFEVRVAREQVERAQSLLAEARAAGPAAADEAEQASEEEPATGR